MSIVFEASVVETVSISATEATVAVRVHRGELRLGAHVSEVVRPDGHASGVFLEVVDVSLTPTIPTDVLGANYGGAVTLVGPIPEGLGPDWVLRDESAQTP